MGLNGLGGPLAASMLLIITTSAALVLCSPSALQAIHFHADILGLVLEIIILIGIVGGFCFTIAQDILLETKGNVILSLVVLRQLFFSRILRSLSSQEIREQYDSNNTQQVYWQSIEQTIYLALFHFFFQNCKH